MKQTLIAFFLVLTSVCFGQQTELALSVPNDLTITFGCRSTPFQIELKNTGDEKIDLGEFLNPHGLSKLGFEVRASDGVTHRIYGRDTTSDKLGHILAAESRYVTVSLLYDRWSGLKNLREKVQDGASGAIEFEMRVYMLSTPKVGLGRLFGNESEVWRGIAHSDWVKVIAYEIPCEQVSPINSSQSLRD